jgi:leucyl aminopeptidase (aminopeptidase T)
MNTRKSDRVYIITDHDTQLIGEALGMESENVGAATKVVYLENYGARPITEVPQKLLQDRVDFEPTVTYYAAEGQPGEVKMRMHLARQSRQAYQDKGIPHPRHGHMVGITPQLIEEGMNADYHEVNRITFQVLDLVKNSHIIQVKSSKGTDITVTFDSDLKWVPCHGLYHNPGDDGNLPEGEVFTCPDIVNGIVVADLIGDYFSPKYGVLNTPVTFEIKDSLVKRVSCQNRALADELWDYLTSVPNGTRVGEFAIGTNTAVTQLSGNLLQDEKIPGIHIAFGNPIPYFTGADWVSDVHVDVVPINCTIIVDDSILMKDGQFIL